MIRSILITLFCLSSTLLSGQDRINGLDILSEYMIGSFNSSEQAKKDTNYFNIRLDMHHIWKDQEGGFWLYVEQAINKPDAKPYRQRVYHVEEIGPNSFKSTIYKLDSADLYTGLHKNVSIEETLTRDNIERLPGCALELSYDGNHFSGQTKKGACLNSWGKATYATSEVEVFEDKMISWDRGWNDKDEYVWGAEKAGYIFIKQ